MPNYKTKRERFDDVLPAWRILIEHNEFTVCDLVDWIAQKEECPEWLAWRELSDMAYTRSFELRNAERSAA